MSLFKKLRAKWLLHRYRRTHVLISRERALHNMHMAQLRAQCDALALQLATHYAEAAR